MGKDPLCERHTNKNDNKKKGLIPENNIEPVSAPLLERQTMGQPCSLICQGLVLRVSIRGLLISPRASHSHGDASLTEAESTQTHTHALTMRHAGARARHGEELRTHPRLLVIDLDPAEGNGQEHLLLVFPLRPSCCGDALRTHTQRQTHTQGVNTRV